MEISLEYSSKMCWETGDKVAPTPKHHAMKEYIGLDGETELNGRMVRSDGRSSTGRALGIRYIFLYIFF
jgi:hypothetical protein